MILSVGRLLKFRQKPVDVYYFLVYNKKCGQVISWFLGLKRG